MLANGRFSHTFSATHGDFSKIPPNFWTNAARSMALMAFMSGSAAATAANPAEHRSGNQGQHRIP